MSRWGKERKRAYHAGELHADGGGDTRAEWAARHMGDDYDEGYRRHVEYLIERVNAENPSAESIIRDLLAAIPPADLNGSLAEAAGRAREYLESVK